MTVTGGAEDRTSPIGVVEAIRRVTAAVGAIPKAHKITEGPAKYAYRGIDDIVEAVQPALIEHGLVIFPERTAKVYEMRQTRNGGALQWVSLDVQWKIIGPDGWGVHAMTVGEATDTSDKATNKAHTAAYKILLSELFHIPFSGEDPDATRNEYGEAKQTDPWAGADPDTLAALAAQEERLINLRSDLFDKATAKASAQYGSPVDSIRSTGPGWLNYWTGLLDAAYKALDKEAGE